MDAFVWIVLPVLGAFLVAGILLNALVDQVVHLVISRSLKRKENNE